MGREKAIEINPDWLANIRAWLDRGAIEDRNWYREARAWCHGTAGATRTDLRRVAAVLASMSPGTSWERNKLEARALLDGETGQAFTTYPANVLKAENIRAAKRQDCYHDLVKPNAASGWKVGSFYRNIVDPESPEAVTIDRHAIAIAIGHAPDEQELRITAWRYRCLAEAYRIVARERGMVPNEVQAITWCEYRRTNGDLHQEPLPF